MVEIPEKARRPHLLATHSYPGQMGGLRSQPVLPGKFSTLLRDVLRHSIQATSPRDGTTARRSLRLRPGSGITHLWPPPSVVTAKNHGMVQILGFPGNSTDERCRRKVTSTFPWYRRVGGPIQSWRVGGPIQSLVPESGWPHPIPSLLSCPQSDHDWRGDSATGYQQSC